MKPAAPVDPVSPAGPVVPVRRKALPRGRILRIELRRSAALWLGVLVLVGSVAFLQFLSGPWSKGPWLWTAQWASTALWERFLLVLLWPLSVAGGAVLGLRDHRSGMDELLTATARPAWQRAARTAGAPALTLTAAYVLVFLYGAVRVIAEDGYTASGWLPVLLVGALALVAGVWLGMGVARTVPSALTPPVLAVATLAAVLVLSDTVMKDLAPNRIMLLSPSLNGESSPFLAVAGRVSAGQAVWLLGLAATGFLLLVARKPRARLLALLPVVLGAALALPLLPADRQRNHTVDTTATALVCEGRVCVTRLHASRLAWLTGPGEEALRLLATLPDPPTAVRETTDAWPPGARLTRAASTVPIDADLQALRRMTKEEATRLLLAGAGTAACVEPDPEYLTEEQTRLYDEDKAVRELAARTVAAAWFTGELKPLPGTSWLRSDALARAEPAWDALRALPADEQRARIVALRTAALSCEGDLLRVLADDRRR
ncbi:hypothetical protein [Streptomyces sp. AK02-01A]|uniref:hypothetical protein n=1 Tax=Streptomyces sp. AK02-01A TaxID=3028648 RepID=UPI0029AD2233|nr:hypothetical protein [Streptomyces sp. AK02-01A]MDX3855640.1 hypothetical protein [Streptomyces sp. AK02-01A]